MRDTIFDDPLSLRRRLYAAGLYTILYFALLAALITALPAGGYREHIVRGYLFGILFAADPIRGLFSFWLGLLIQLPGLLCGAAFIAHCYQIFGYVPQNPVSYLLLMASLGTYLANGAAAVWFTTLMTGVPMKLFGTGQRNNRNTIEG